MAIFHFGRRFVVEKPGPDWHLVGTVRRHGVLPNRLILIRRADPLSKILRGVMGAYLPAVQITDLRGISARLTRVQILGKADAGHSQSARGNGEHENDTSEQEEFSLVFSKIATEYIAGSTSTADDWNQQPQ